MKLLRAFAALVVMFTGGYFLSEHFYDFVFPPEVTRMYPAPVAQPIQSPASVPEPVASAPAPTPVAPASVASAPKPVASSASAPKLVASEPQRVASEPKPVAPAVAPAPAPAPKAAASTPVTELAPTPAPAPVSVPVTAPTPKPVAAPVVQPLKQGPPINKPPEVLLTIRDIKFNGATQFSEKELAGVVSEFIGKELTVQEAFAIPAKIGNHYKSRNLMAIANLVGGMTRDGVLTVGVVEMQMTQSQAEKELTTLEKRSVEPRSMTAMSAVEKLEVGEGPQPGKPTPTIPFVEKMSDKTSPAKIADPIPTPKSAPAVTTTTAPAPTAVTAPVTAPVTATAPLPTTAPLPAPTTAASPPRAADKAVDEETEFILKHYAKQSRQYEVMVDNYGTASTGSTRVGASFVLGEDKLSLLGLKSQGSDYLRMAARWATGVDGLKLGVNASKLNYDVVNHLQTALYQSGDAAKKGVDLIYQWVNEPSHISSVGLHYVSKSINSIGINLADSASVTSRVPSIEWKGMLREMIPGGAVFTYDTVYSHGHADASGASTMGGLEISDGMFSKLRFDGSVMQPLSALGSVWARLTLQQSDKNLDPSERLYLGGPLGVRAYGMGVGVGSQGGLASLEFRQRLDASTTLSEFYDWGSVRQVNDGNPATVLKGYGLSVSHDLGDGVTLKATLARRAGQVPMPNLPQDSDGQYDRNRFWLSMETRF